MVNDEIDLITLFRVLWEGRLVIAICLLVGFGFATGLSFYFYPQKTVMEKVVEVIPSGFVLDPLSGEGDSFLRLSSEIGSGAFFEEEATIEAVGFVDSEFISSLDDPKKEKIKKIPNQFVVRIEEKGREGSGSEMFFRTLKSRIISFLLQTYGVRETTPDAIAPDADLTSIRLFLDEMTVFLKH